MNSSRAVLVSVLCASLCGGAAAHSFTLHAVPGDAYNRPHIQVTTISDEIEQGALRFVEGLTRQGIDFLSNETLSHDQRVKEFKELLRTSFDMKTIGRFTLGRYWRQATPAQQSEYLKLFEDSVINSYARRFEEYQGQTVVVNNARNQGEKDTIVSSDIVSDDGSPQVRVDWRIRKKGSSYKVVDVIVEGVSMAVTQRSDFASVIQRGGGNIDVLLEHLRKS